MMQIGIIGSGAMGAGIAQVAATAGHDVILYDAREQALTTARDQLRKTLDRLVEKGKWDVSTATTIFGRFYFASSLESMKDCGLVIEAIVEDEAIKRSVFVEVESIVGPQTILASNTSSLSIASLAAACQKPERFIGIHFFNPAPIMPLVEIIPALQTNPGLPEKVIKLIRQWGKKPVLAKDTPGFIVNRIARPYYSEAIRIYEEGLATMAEIDYIMKNRGGFRMGPFELMDFIGHDVNYAVTESVWRSCHFEPRYQPSFTQRRLVEAGWLGRKTGRGFYSYAPDNVPPTEPVPAPDRITSIFERILAMLINEAADALYYGVANRDDIDLAMTSGVNYPKGLLVWADEWGIARCEAVLDRLFNFYHEPRYRCSPGLRQKTMECERFYPQNDPNL